MPKRINKAIELLEAKQPVYYTMSYKQGKLSYDNGRAMAGTWADIINVDMEHRPFDPQGLHDFMQGLVDAGPTASGHRTPAVVCSVPITARSADEVRYNAWMFKQVLAAGVHGVLCTHVENAGAVKEFVQGCRYAFQSAGVGEGLDPGRRGSAGQESAAEFWGVSISDYLRLADPWPLNPQGELILGLKIETKWGLNNVESTMKVPGVCFAEWGPGDMGMSYGLPEAHDPPYPPQMQAAMDRVKKACDENGHFFLNMVLESDVKELLDRGVMVCSSGQAGEAVAKIGRAHTGRTMPV